MFSGQERYERAVRECEEAEAALKAYQRLAGSGVSASSPARDAAVLIAKKRLEAAHDELFAAYDQVYNEEA